MALIAEGEKRQAILKAALELIAQRGLNDTPVSLIVKHSGVSTGIVYHYFENKDDIIHALYTDIKQRIGKAMMAGIEPQAFWFDRWKQVWHNVFDFYAVHPREVGFLEQYENSPYYHTWDESQMPQEIIDLYGMAQADIQQGYVKALPIEAALAMTVGVAILLAKQHNVGRFSIDAVMLEAIAVACCEGVRA
jgi:TetR/AcrR family transcriptional regulator, repressor of fatR-cypB operon